MPAKGEKAPRFVLRDENGESVDSEMLIGLRYILFCFNGEAGARICSEYMSIYPKLAIRNILLFGVSRKSYQDNSHLRSSFGIKEKLLSDPDGMICLEPGATMLVGKGGTIEEIWKDAPMNEILKGTLAHFRQE